ncbi:hypothetical protein [Clostridium tertium]|jgi:hypothetical protein|uniref:hypothetical protein n=1 Tax=Clostridium tertium TaxID=1559 RepID=UPI002A83E5E1|nr:hypothetical protein [Clostridium tertium]MDY4604233.1 hypothetical protein [Clostridium tertium]
MNLINILNEKEISLIVSLPENNVELAKAALLAGADVLKIHINVEHRASKTRFGSLTEELEVIKKIVSLCNEYDKPIGIVAGGHDKIPMKEIEGIMTEGFSFISLYDKHMNPLIFNKDIYRMVAIDNNYKLEYVKAYDELPIDVLECSIMDPETYGDELTVREILQYQSIRSTTSKPMVIPTQRNITPEQVLILQEMGINAIMIGAIVTGKTKDSIYESTLKYRNMIDNFNSERVINE